MPAITLQTFLAEGGGSAWHLGPLTGAWVGEAANPKPYLPATSQSVGPSPSQLFWLTVLGRPAQGGPFLQWLGRDLTSSTLWLLLCE